MASTPKKTDAAPEIPAPIIIKKIVGGHGGAHGGAWKIALADMMKRRKYREERHWNWE